MARIKVYCYIESQHNADDTWQYRNHFLFQPNLAAAKKQWNSRGNTDGYKFWMATVGQDYNGPIVKGAIVVGKWSEPKKFDL